MHKPLNLFCIQVIQHAGQARERPRLGLPGIGLGVRPAPIQLG